MSGFMNLPNEPPVRFPGREKYPLFTRVSIETINFCNRSCVFCPLHWSEDERGHKTMTDALYAKVVAELGAVKFAGVVQMFLLSEPFIDRSMIDKLHALRAACPKVTIYASTNGDVFDQVLRTKGLTAALDKIIGYYEAGLTTMNINVYDEGPEQLERYQSLVRALLEQTRVRPTQNKYRKHSPKGWFVELTDMRIESNPNASLTNTLYIKPKEERGSITAPQIHCSRTQRHIVVEWDGNVPICCAVDVTDKTLPSMGDVNTQSLLEVWNGEPMMRYRWFTQQKQRVLPGCSTCTHRMAFPAIVRKIKPSRELKARWEHDRA